MFMLPAQPPRKPELLLLGQATGHGRLAAGLRRRGAFLLLCTPPALPTHRAVPSGSHVAGLWMWMCGKHRALWRLPCRSHHFQPCAPAGHFPPSTGGNMPEQSRHSGPTDMGLPPCVPLCRHSLTQESPLKEHTRSSGSPH